MRHQIFLALQYGLSAGLAMVLAPLLIRSGGPSLYGVAATDLAAASLVAAWASYGFSQTAARDYLCADLACRSAVYWRIVVIRLLLASVAVLLAGCSGWLSWQACLLTAMLCFTSAVNSLWRMQALERFDLSFALTLGGACAALLLAGAAFWVPDRLVVSLALLAPALVAGWGSFVLSASKESPAVRRLMVSGGDVLLVLRRDFSLFVSQAIVLGYSGVGTMLVASQQGHGAAALYSLMERLSAGVLMFCLLPHAVMYPSLVQARIRSSVEYGRVLQRMFTTGVLIALAGVLVTVLWPDDVWHWLFPDASASDLEGYLPLGIAWSAASVAGTCLTSHLVLSGRQQQVLPVTLAILGLSWAAGVFGLHAVGGRGWLLGLLLAQLINVVLLLKELRVLRRAQNPVQLESCVG